MTGRDIVLCKTTAIAIGDFPGLISVQEIRLQCRRCEIFEIAFRLSLAGVFSPGQTRM